ncbi:hypothetical protein [Hymenobacter actinosclerus]|uniref:Uncharacterized protein n=1 Tax=Hymenobacter actinosclerus TaxID=82805 RepID=A0A1I0I2R1_9BACT|nr:hypothetical protein [Hymenobacter actinosclerus]SET90099.1 hypothetical protein SAMN04487998_3071 [Hymenobacter actinosclerus]
MPLLTILDETASGSIINRLELEISQETLTVREMITRRVLGEVAAYNERQNGVFQGLVQPTESERALNGYKLRPTKRIDGEQQQYRALEAFQQNGFFVLVNDRQAESLDDTVWLGDGATVSFVKLTPLVGG